MQALLILTTLPDQDTARQLARQLVEAKLAACVNVLAPCTSVYRWEAAVQEETEIPLLIKTAADRYAAVETFLRQHHSYELPEIVALPIVQGLPGYLDWVRAETRA
jgi:periplasmic divalent cation tolerance protein